MRIVTSADDAMKNQRRIQVNGKEYTLNEFVGSMPLRGHYQEGNEANDDGRPQGFLVTQPPGSITPAHFHEPNQFQVFVAGSGRLGAKAAPPVTVQYANGHTPYGPIVAGPDGLSYFTLRQRWDPGAKYVPASLPQLKKGNQRTRMVSGIAVADDSERRARTAAQVETIFETEADGLTASVCRLGPQQPLTGLPHPSSGGGQYLLVIGGSMLHDGNELPKLSTIFISPEDETPTVGAGALGLDLLVLQFPRLARASAEAVS